MKSTAKMILLTAIAYSAAVYSDPADPYALPRDKTAIPPCKKAALTLHPGMVTDYRQINREGGVYVRYSIQAADGRAWEVLCDGVTGKIIHAWELDDALTLPPE